MHNIWRGGGSRLESTIRKEITETRLSLRLPKKKMGTRWSVVKKTVGVTSLHLSSIFNTREGVFYHI